jgi:ppGpp synthetase/RelA/SpoT-type nucleotidyltranferase
MPPLSRAQIDQLGRRLRDADPSLEDLRLLEQVRNLYQSPLAQVIQVLVDLGLEPGSRPKTTGTIVEKLRRLPSLRLSEMQDLVGARVVLEMTRGEQDALVERITARFENSRTVDRRARPSHGYRAVHVIARVEGRPVEIQVRTRLQDLWAQIVERLADEWGRGIRYGEAPAQPDLELRGMTRQRFLDSLMELANEVEVVEQVRQRFAERERIVEVVRQSGQLPRTSEETVALFARFEERELRLRRLLEELHTATTPRTLGR